MSGLRVSAAGYPPPLPLKRLMGEDKEEIDKREDGVGVVEAQYFTIDSLTLENGEKLST